MIKFSETDINLGIINYGKEGRAVVEVSNLYNQEVKLETANSSCSCTTGSLKEYKLQPNQKTQFTIILNSTKAGRAMNQSKTIQLKYIVNGETHSQTFRIKVNVV